MVDNQYNYFRTAPDKGECVFFPLAIDGRAYSPGYDINLVLEEQNGPVWLKSGSFEAYMSQHLKNHNQTSVGTSENLKKAVESASNSTATAAASSYWLPKLAPLEVASTPSPLRFSTGLI